MAGQHDIQNFMTPVGGASGNELWAANVDLHLSVVDMDPVLWAILKKDRGFLGSIGGPVGTPAHNAKIEWIEGELNPDVLTADYTFADDTADNLVISLVGVDSATAARIKRSLREGTILKPEGTTFLYQVDAQGFGSTTITITAYASKGAGNSDADGSRVWQIIGHPLIPGSDVTDDISRPREVQENYLQIFERAVGIDKMRQSIRMYTVPDEVKLQSMHRLIELHNELNKCAINMYPGAASVNQDRPTMGGLRSQIEDKGNSDTYKNLSAVPLTISIINDMLEKMWDQGGIAPTDRMNILVNSFQHRKISAFSEDIVRTRLADKTAGTIITQLQGDIGPILNVRLDRHMPTDSFSIYPSGKVKLRHGQGDQFQLVAMGLKGRRISWQLSGSYSLMIMNAGVSSGWGYNLTTS